MSVTIPQGAMQTPFLTCHLQDTFTKRFLFYFLSRFCTRLPSKLLKDAIMSTINLKSKNSTWVNKNAEFYADSESVSKKVA